MVKMIGAAAVSLSTGVVLAGGSPAYVVPNAIRVEKVVPLLTVGDQADNGYTIVGVPDGMGAHAAGAGQFRLLVNHEFGQNAGAVHAHGATGAFVSDWTIGFAPTLDGSFTFDALSGADAFDAAFDWNGAEYVQLANKFQAFCSAYLAGPYSGFDRYVFMTGEETPGTNNFDGVAGGQSVAVFDGEAYTLPRLGRFSHEQQIVLPGTGSKTVVFGCDDFFGGTPAHVFLYVGEKDRGATDALRINGLDNGQLYVLKVAGVSNEGDVVKGVSYPASFEPVNWDQDTNGLHAEAGALGAFGMVRVEDAQYDPNDPKTIYWVTTGASNTPQNLNGKGYRITLNDLTDPLAGGSFEVILDGTEGVISPDNIGIDSTGTLLIQEDAIYNLAQIGLSRDASIWAYDLKTGALSRPLEFDTSLAASIDLAYTPGKWETSGVISMEDILGPGWWLFNVQAHYNLPSPLVQGGQLLAVKLGFGQTREPAQVVSTSPRTRAIVPILSVADEIGGYPFVGLPDGMGVYAVADDGSMKVLINHEFGQSAGALHAHGGTGSFVSEWSISYAAADDGAYEFNVTDGKDHITAVKDYDDSSGVYVDVMNGQFARLCSAYLAGPQSGFDQYVFLTGEESGNTATLDGIAGGQSFAVIDGTAWALPRLGRYPKENQVAIPGTGPATVVFGLDDANPSYPWIYVGTKVPDSPDVLERYGLSNGKLYVMVVDGATSENQLSKGFTASFSLVEVDWTAPVGTLKTQAAALGGLNCVRIEDGHYDPRNYNDFYFCTTGALGSGNDNGKLYRVSFEDVANPTAGGTITAVLDGSEGWVSPDNFGINSAGEMLIQEDPTYDLVGRNSSMWLYDIDAATLDRVGEVDQALQQELEPGSPLGDWETSGAIALDDTLGLGWWLVNVQAHYNLPSPLVQGGQLLAVRIGDVPDPFGDLDGDGIVNAADLALLLAAWGSSGPFGDLNQDGVVDGSDLALLLAGWTN